MWWPWLQLWMRLRNAESEMWNAGGEVGRWGGGCGCGCGCGCHENGWFPTSDPVVVLHNAGEGSKGGTPSTALRFLPGSD